MFLVFALSAAERHPKIFLTVFLAMVCAAVPSQTAVSSDILRSACDAHDTYPKAYMAGSCWVVIDDLQSYDDHVNACASLSLAPGIDNGRLGNIAQKRSLMRRLYEEMDSLGSDDATYINLKQSAGSAEPIGTWDICFDALQTECYPIDGLVLPWFNLIATPGVPGEPNDAGGEHHGAVNLGNDDSTNTIGVADETSTDNKYGLCEFPSNGDEGTEYHRVAENYQANATAQFPSTLVLPTHLHCARECFKEKLCVSYVYNPTTGPRDSIRGCFWSQFAERWTKRPFAPIKFQTFVEGFFFVLASCVLQYMMYADWMTHDRTQPQAAPGWNWYEPVY